jgi:hypothetical protein
VFLVIVLGVDVGDEEEEKNKKSYFSFIKNLI